MEGYVYMLECSDGSFYVGSTVNLEKRILQHQNGEGANYTRKRLPVNLVHVEQYLRIDAAFFREKQLKKWSRIKKQALIHGTLEKLPKLAACKNDSHFRFFKEIE